MRKFLLPILILSFLMTANVTRAQLFKKEESKPGLFFGKQDNKRNNNTGFFGQKKKKKGPFNKHILGVGVVVGQPTGIGGRIEFQPTRFGIAVDGSVNRFRTDTGPLITAAVVKMDARYYMKGFLGNLLRIYGFAGFTLTRGEFADNGPENVLQADMGVGGGLRLGKITINAEGGVLIPAQSAENYKARFGAFGNIAVLFWIF